MAKENVKGLFDNLGMKNNKVEKTEIKVETEVEKVEEAPKKSTRGRKKKVNEVAFNFTGKGLKITNKNQRGGEGEGIKRKKGACKRLQRSLTLRTSS